MNITDHTICGAADIERIMEFFFFICQNSSAASASESLSISSEKEE